MGGFERRELKRKVTLDAQRYFITGISMITSSGSKGQNVMAAEWTMQISYKPMLIAVFIHEGSNTLENIRKTKEFGVNVASAEQTTAVSISGGYSRKEIDKLEIRDFFQTIRSTKIRPRLLAGCVINAECQLLLTKRIGDHTMVVGKVVSIKYDKTKKPLVYHQSKYFQIGTAIEPNRYSISVSQKVFDFFSSKARGKFILKCAGTIIRRGNKVLVLDEAKERSFHIIPYVIPHADRDQKKALETHLRKIKLDVTLKRNPYLKRLILKHGKKTQRLNFILFPGKLEKKSTHFLWKPIAREPILEAIVK